MKLAFLLALAAQAAFYHPGDIDPKPASWDRVGKAVHRISMDSGETCSGAFVSPDGYFLTALHCMETCLKHAGKPYVYEGVDGLYSLRPTPAGAAGTQCPGYSSAYMLSGVQASRPKIVAIGRGTETFRDERIEEIPEAALARLPGLVDDWALLKYEVPGPVDCLPLAAEPKEGDTLWGYGYPSWTNRPGGNNSAGVHTPHASSGKVLGSIRQDAYLPSIIRSEEGWRRESLLFDQPHVLLAVVDSAHGASGEPLLDSRGELAGVLYTSVKSSHDKELGDAAIAIRASHVLREAAEALGVEGARTAFSCPRTRPKADLAAAKHALRKFR